MFLEKKEEGQIKRLPVKATFVKDKEHPYVREHQHVDPNKNKPSGKSSRTDGYDFSEDDIHDVRKLSGGEKGITQGTLIAETSKGRFFVKPVEGEKMSSGYRNIFHTVTFNEKNTGRKLSPEEAESVQFKPDIRKNYIGTQADREVMATRLAGELGFDHIPHAEIKNLLGEDALVMRDVHEIYKDRYEKIVTSNEVSRTFGDYNT